MCIDELEDWRKATNSAMKPADSDQIAKAREWLRELLERVGVGHITYACFEDKQGNGWSVPELLAAFAASERQAVIEECAKVAEDPANREPGWSLSTQRMIAAAIRSME